MGAVKAIPENSSVVMPRLFCRDPLAELEFCRDVFRALELTRRPGPGGGISHALITIGGAMIMIESEWPNFASKAPQMDASSPVALFVYIEDVDQALDRAAAAGAKVLVPAANQFWGDRIGWVMDTQGRVDGREQGGRNHGRAAGCEAGQDHGGGALAVNYCRKANVKRLLPAATATYCRPFTE